MKRFVYLAALVLAFSLRAGAQDTPAWELSAGYSYLNANLSGPGPSFSLNGGGGSITQNVNDWFGGRVEINACGGSVLGTNVTAQTFTYAPVFSYRRSWRYTPFGEVQVGAIHGSQGYLGISQSANKFAIAPGGGVDFRLNDRLGVRVQAHYLMSRFLSLRQDNIQVSTGLVFYIGRK